MLSDARGFSVGSGRQWRYVQWHNFMEASASQAQTIGSFPRIYNPGERGRRAQIYAFTSRIRRVSAEPKG